MTYREFLKQQVGVKGHLSNTSDGVQNCCYTFTPGSIEGYHILTEVHDDFAVFRYEGSNYRMTVPLGLLVLDIPPEAEGT